MIDTQTTDTQTRDSSTARSTWTLDAAHSSLHFSGRQMMISTVRGHFARFDARIEGSDEDPESASVQVTVEAASLHTGLDQRDEHLRSPDLLDVANFPNIEFRSTSIKKANEDRLAVEGDLTIKGVTRPMQTEATLRGVAVGMSGARRAAFTTEFTIDRGDWGMTFNVPLGGDAVLIGREITLQFELTVEEQAAETGEESPSA
ncbi:MAG: YceI family protein [Chloroflexi bacterium]|nr:YceI family protein [Chloroflexota bacterium]MBA3797143.1 YceI family protein [Chloroflexota bacterium]